MADSIAFLLVLAVGVAIYGLPLWLVATVARKRGRDPLLWAILSLFITPIIALALVAMLPPGDGSGPGRSPPGAPA